MQKYFKSILGVMALCLVWVGICSAQAAFQEVDKGGIPEQFLDVNLKQHPLGFKIWDEKEAVSNLQEKGEKLLWVDTRLLHLYTGGTVKNAILLTYDKNETLPEAERGETRILTKESLETEMKKIDADLNNVIIVFFCQGPKCHRSYNAALRAIQQWGFKLEQVIWFRSGFPGLFSYVKENPELERKMNKFLQGDVVGI